MHNPPETGALTYETARFTLRAPRVAVVFDGGSDWQFWALSAMHSITHTWGGSGFVLVPHHNGEVSPVIAEAVRRYDPDFVVPAPRRLKDVAQSRPSALREVVVDSTEEPADEPLATSGDHCVQDVVGHQAATQLAERCSVYRRRVEWEWHYDSLALASTTAYPPTAVDVTDHFPCISVPPQWGGPLALMAAVTFGNVEQPTADRASLDEAQAAAVLRHTLQPKTWHQLPQELVYDPSAVGLDFDVATLPGALTATESGLSWVGRPAPTPRRFRYVVGDGPDDFALAMIMNRISRDTYWMHPDWLPSGASELGRAVRETTTTLLSSPSTRWSSLDILSTTKNREELEPWVQHLQQPDHGIFMSADGVTWTPPQYKQRNVGAGAISMMGERNLHLAADDQFDQRIPIPVTKNSDGAIVVAASLPLPTTATGSATDRPYQVDFDLDIALLPTGRGLDGRSLLRTDHEWHTWARSGRDAISYQARRFDFVAAGATQHGQLATPRLQVPSLGGWVAQMAMQSDYTIAPSDAGQKAALVAALWGGRSNVARDITSPFRSVLSTMASPPKGDHDSYLDGTAIRLSGDRGVISFPGIRKLWRDAVGLDEVRDTIDNLTSRGVLRRGLLLRCPGCTLLSFIAVDNLVQTSRCARCLGSVELTRSNWGKSLEEPTWFYDAHPLAAELVTTHGDVPFLLAKHLAKPTSRFADLGELEFRKNGSSCAEIDLIALAGDHLVVAETKSNSTLGDGRTRQRAINKRLLIARVLQADEVVFATTAAEWSTGVREEVSKAMAKFDWMGTRPNGRMISGLGGSVHEVFV